MQSINIYLTLNILFHSNPRTGIAGRRWNSSYGANGDGDVRSVGSVKDWINWDYTLSKQIESSTRGIMQWCFDF